MQYSKKIFYTIAGLMFVFSSCTKDFQDLNTTPGKPTNTTIPPLVNGVISTMFLKGAEQVAVHNEWYYPATQLGALSGSSGYLIESGANDIWNDYYNTLQNLNLIQDKIKTYSDTATDKESMDQIQSIVYILRAYKTFRVTDQFGDIPYFQAGKAYTEDATKYRVAYDSQKLIYDSLLLDLSWAASHIKAGANPVTTAGNAYQSLGASETFFGNNMSKWLSFCNSLRLRYAMQMVEKDPTAATPIIADILTSGAPLITEGNDVGMWPGSFDKVLTDSRWWSFNSHKFMRVSATFWNQVADGTDDADIFDPRAYLFAETNQAGNWAPYTVGSGATDATNPYSDDRDNNNGNKGNDAFSAFNYYLVRDIYYQPELFMTAAEVHFLKAEAYARGLGVTKDMAEANTEYVAGITSSVNFWYKIAANTNVDKDNWSAVAPPAPTDAQMTTLLSNPKVAFTGVDDDDLAKIYAQEWLSFYREPWLAFNLWRRTGKTPRIGEPAAYVSFNRLAYPQSEALENTANYNTQTSAMGGNGRTVKVWWMK